MYYKIHPDRIILEDENGARVAEIDYPEIRSGLCEITHIYGNDDAEGLRQADNLMDLCVRELRSSGRKCIASSKYASSWFDNHPDAKDILIDASSIDSGVYGEFDLNSRPATFDATASIDTEAVRRATSGTSGGYTAEGRSDAHGYASPSSASTERPSGSSPYDRRAARNAVDDDPEGEEEWDRTDRILRGEIRKKRRRDYRGNQGTASDYSDSRRNRTNPRISYRSYTVLLQN